ncbi:nuclear condensing complex subunit [Schizophyllum commune]
MPRQSDTDVLGGLQGLMSSIFDQAQNTVANHKKNCVQLHKLHEQAAKVTEQARNGQAVKLVGERAFTDAFIDMASRVVEIKKGPPAAERVVKFVGSGISARFIVRLLNWLLMGFNAKNKVTRWRVVQIVSELIAHLGELDEDMYTKLRSGLLARVYDKESPVRVQATIALSKLIGTDDADELPDGEPTILQTLIEVLTTDPAPEVRRAALLNVPLLNESTPAILARSRDVDALTRKLVFSTVMAGKLSHPRLLTIAQREKVVKNGLGDREPGVRMAAAKMVTGWFERMLNAEDAEGQPAAAPIQWRGDEGGIMHAFIRFLCLFDVVGLGEAVATDAVLSVLVTKPQYTEAFVFEERYWLDLTPESAVLARIFIEECAANEKADLMESASVPVVTAFAFLLQERYNTMLQRIQGAEMAAGSGISEEQEEELEEEIAKAEVILAELLRISKKLDYMDEIGRRKVFSVVKDMLAHPQLPPGLINHCLDVMLVIMDSERDLIRIVVEIVIDLRDEDAGMEENPNSTMSQSEGDTTTLSAIRSRDRSVRRKGRDEMTAEERMQADVTDMRCLILCIGMLERINGSFEDNSTLEGILADLIIPAVKRKELVMREKGLVALGLCCLIAKNMAVNSFQLFLSQVQAAPEELKLKVLQIVLDILIMYDQEFFGKPNDITPQVITYLLHTLQNEDSHQIQATLCIGLSKLLLAGLVYDEKVLTSLLMAYVSPATAGNLELRQCLSYFFPVYCYSSAENQLRMQKVFNMAFNLMARAYEELEGEQDMVTPQQFGMLFVHWTDPEQLMEGAIQHTTSKNPHVELALDIIMTLYDSERSEEDHKALAQLLQHLKLPADLDDRMIIQLDLLLTHVKGNGTTDDPTIDKALDKFQARFKKTYSKRLPDINRSTYLDEEMLKLYEYVEVDPPEAVIVASSSKTSMASGSTLVPSRSTPKAEAGRTTPTKSQVLQPIGNVVDDEPPISRHVKILTPMKQHEKRSRSPESARKLSSPGNRKRTRSSLVPSSEETDDSGEEDSEDVRRSLLFPPQRRRDSLLSDDDDRNSGADDEDL